MLLLYDVAIHVCNIREFILFMFEKEQAMSCDKKIDSDTTGAVKRQDDNYFYALCLPSVFHFPI